MRPPSQTCCAPPVGARMACRPPRVVATAELFIAAVCLLLFLLFFFKSQLTRKTVGACEGNFSPVAAFRTANKRLPRLKMFLSQASTVTCVNLFLRCCFQLHHHPIRWHLPTMICSSLLACCGHIFWLYDHVRHVLLVAAWLLITT